ncbi:hypothetical protein [Sedimenticola sp.]|uniref:hypothetical protein n=1 Tax=Sedimenticola sp. TaxID=1940285 RepID=UPI003D0E60B0
MLNRIYPVLLLALLHPAQVYATDDRHDWFGRMDGFQCNTDIAEIGNRQLQMQSSSPDYPASDTLSAEKDGSVKLGGSVRMNYTLANGDQNSKDKNGDMVFGPVSITMETVRHDLRFCLDYQSYGYMDVIRHGWMGSRIGDNWQWQLGVVQKPFGIMPYESHNWWYGIPYYIGLSDDTDLGANFSYRSGPWDMQLGFFKNGEWGDAYNTGRYSIDVIRDDDQSQANEEINQFNARATRQFALGNRSRLELGISAEWGELYNGTTERKGNHWAVALHSDAVWGPVNLQLEAIRYQYNPENPGGVSDTTVLMGGYTESYEVASEGSVYVANLSYDQPVRLGAITNIKYYADYSVLGKAESGFNDSVINTLGLSLDANPIFVYVDYVEGKNAAWINYDAGGNMVGMGQGNTERNSLVNIHVGYYF